MLVNQILLRVSHRLTPTVKYKTQRSRIPVNLFIHSTQTHILYSKCILQSHILIFFLFLILNANWGLADTDLENLLVEEKAIEHNAEILSKQLLLKTFGLESTPAGPVEPSRPPEFMLELYRQSVYGKGLSIGGKNQKPTAIRSFPDYSGHGNRFTFIFDINSLSNKEQLLNAELHATLLRSVSSQRKRTTFYIYLASKDIDWTNHKIYHMKLLNVTSDIDTSTSDIQKNEKRLIFNLDLFDLQSILRNVVKLLVSIEPLSETLDLSDRDVKAKIKACNKHFVRNKDESQAWDIRASLVLYLGDDSTMALPGPHQKSTEIELITPPDYWKRYISTYNSEDNSVSTNYQETINSRSKRSAKRMSSYKFFLGSGDRCRLNEFYVDFNEIGWSNWIIAPNGYKANICHGECPFPLGKQYNATNHATVQAILNMQTFNFLTGRGLLTKVPKPNCVPDSLESLHVLYYDDRNNVVLKVFEDMSATQCGCY